MNTCPPGWLRQSPTDRHRDTWTNNRREFLTDATRPSRNFAPFVRQTGERKAQTCAMGIFGNNGEFLPEVVVNPIVVLDVRGSQTPQTKVSRSGDLRGDACSSLETATTLSGLNNDLADVCLAAEFDGLCHVGQGRSFARVRVTGYCCGRPDNRSPTRSVISL